MLGFGVASMVALPLWLGGQVMETTNGPRAESALEQELRSRGSVDARMLARAQKERLQVLLDEIKEGKGAARYAAALDGRSLGTHSTGTTTGAVAIRITAENEKPDNARRL
jgi:hypothetical protein